MIKVQELASKMTQEALTALLRSSQFIPDDKWDWSPGGASRPVNDQLAECIQYAERMCLFLTADFVPTQYGRAQIKARQEQILEQCKDLRTTVELARSKYTQLYQVLENTPDSRLDQDFLLPFAPGRTFSGVDLLFMAYWNLVYHLGQVNYIQAILGDIEMH